jgi:hypothetical protein
MEHRKRWAGRRARPTLLALATSPLFALVALLLAAGCGSERSSADRTSSRVLPCTGPHEPANFSAYSLGPTFENLPLTDQDRECDQAPPGAPPERRLNIIEYAYGDCEPPPGEGGCAKPLVVQNWPRCERDPSDYAVSHHNPLKAKVAVRGVPGHLYEGGLRLEVYTGNSTVVVFGTDEARVLRAGRALVKAPSRPSASVSSGDTTTPLPAPPSRPISCS